MAPADWNQRDRDIIDSRYTIWKTANKPSIRQTIIASTSLKCGDKQGDPEGWLESHWNRQIGM
jgi:hypothetical protein